MPPSSFFIYEQLKPKYRVFVQGFPVSTVTCYITKMTASFSAIISVSDGTITLLFRVVVSILLITRSLSSVETFFPSVFYFTITYSRNTISPYIGGYYS